MEAVSHKQKLLAQHQALKTERSTWDSHWRELAEFVSPFRSRWQTSDRNRGTKRHDKIIDSTASLAHRVLSAGMMTHMCVDATARAAADFGFQVIVAEDACATRDLKYGETLIPAEHVHKAFLAALKSYGQVMTSEQVIALLAGEQERAK